MAALKRGACGRQVTQPQGAAPEPAAPHATPAAQSFSARHSLSVVPGPWRHLQKHHEPNTHCSQKPCGPGGCLGNTVPSCSHPPLPCSAPAACPHRASPRARGPGQRARAQCKVAGSAGVRPSPGAPAPSPLSRERAALGGDRGPFLEQLPVGPRDSHVPAQPDPPGALATPAQARGLPRRPLLGGKPLGRRSTVTGGVPPGR